MSSLLINNSAASFSSELERSSRNKKTIFSFESVVIATICQSTDSQRVNKEKEYKKREGEREKESERKAEGR